MHLKLLLCLIFGMLFTSPAMAGVYKCKDAEGTTEYSQFPCQNAATSEEVIVGVPKKVDAEVCALAYDYGLEVATRMRDGSSSGDEKSQLSGQFASSVAASNLIDYVHSFSNQPKMGTDRIADLAMAKCTNGGLGKISANDIPHRTDEEKEQDELLAKQIMQQQALQIPASKPSETTPAALASLTPASTKDALDKSSGDCESYRKKLRTVENAMRDGYSASAGERLRMQNRELKKLIRSTCG